MEVNKKLNLDWAVRSAHIIRPNIQTQTNVPWVGWGCDLEKYLSISVLSKTYIVLLKEMVDSHVNFLGYS